MTGSRFVDAGIENIASCVPWFRAEMTKWGIAVSGGSSLARGMKLTEEFALLARGRPSFKFKGPDGSVRAQAEYLVVTGIDYLTKALHRGVTHGLQITPAQLRTLTRSNPVLTAPARVSHKDRNVTWELLLAALAAPFTAAARLAEPPDVKCTFQGKTVGLSAKVVYTKRTDEFRSDVVKAARQLEHADVDLGLAALNLVEVFPHESYMRQFARIPTGDPEAFTEVMNTWVETFVARQEIQRIAEKLRATPMAAAILFVPTALHFAGQPCPYYRIHYFSRSGDESRALPFIRALNQSSQTVLAWDPSTEAG